MTPNEFIKEFISKNKVFLENLPKNKDSISKDEWDKNSVLVEFYNSFMSEFLDPDKITIDLLGHFSKDEGKTIAQIDLEDNFHPFSNTRILRKFRSYLELSFDFYLGYFKELNPETCKGNPFLDDGVTKLSEVDCFDCGVPVHSAINFKENRIEPTSFFVRYYKGERCECENINYAVTSEISVPSGKLIFSSHFHAVLNDEQQKTVAPDYADSSDSLNSFSGRRKRSKKWEKLNIMVVNSRDLSLLKTPSGNIDIYCPCTYQEVNELDENFKMSTLGEDLGTVYGDVRMTSAMDEAQFLLLCKENNVNPDSIETITVQVECGDYQITDYYDDMKSGGGLNAKIEHLLDFA
jgi:hypothetical protein